ncbi:AAA family ATPase [Saccharothrix luteola]|uniref:AAA family ATPase n=1 Tax=Saccharothrix luteola TaxID=2893018 RepID=UPI001E2D61B6|nr:AAA family ATPase [Saccharothrix luteola]MCC8245049.1 AAA family ATPase [Saccharothrix luteola]
MTGEVEKPVVVAVLGAHSTGKSAFLARLTHELRRDQVQVATVADLGEEAQRIGLPILRNHTWASTLWIITRGISNELEAWLHADVVLVDRAVPDALGYYRAALAHRGEHPDPRVQARLETLVRDHSTTYDLLYRTTLDPDIPLGDNKPRDPDQTFRHLADHHVAAVLHDLALPHRLLPSHGHDHALDDALAFIMSKLSEAESNTS